MSPEERKYPKKRATIDSFSVLLTEFFLSNRSHFLNSPSFILHLIPGHEKKNMKKKLFYDDTNLLLLIWYFFMDLGSKENEMV